MKKLLTYSIIGVIIIFFNNLLIYSQGKSNSNSPSIIITDEKGNKSALRMSELHIDVKVVGNLATTTMEMTFFNDLNRVLEGELNFPLGEGQVINRLAMDFNGSRKHSRCPWASRCRPRANAPA